MGRTAMSTARFAAKVRWEGGVLGALGYGLQVSDAADPELAAAWAPLVEAFECFEAAAEAVQRLVDARPDGDHPGPGETSRVLRMRINGADGDMTRVVDRVPVDRIIDPGIAAAWREMAAAWEALAARCRPVDRMLARAALEDRPASA